MSKPIAELFGDMPHYRQVKLGHKIRQAGMKPVGRTKIIIEVNTYDEKDFDDITLLAARMVRKEALNNAN